MTDAAQCIAALHARQPQLATACARQPLAPLVAQFDGADPALGYGHIPARVRAAVADVQAEFGAAVSDYLWLLLASVVAGFEPRFAASGLGERFRPEFARNFTRILTAAARGGRQARLDDDLFIKDLCIARLTLVPCVSHLMYRHSGIPRKALLRAQGVGTKLRLAGAVAGLGGFAPLIENHVHRAMLEEFHAEGRERCFALLCALFEAWPDSRGLMGTSWYYDPAVAPISPQLAYLHGVPASRGAHFFDMGESEAARADATIRSAQRRRLYEAGEYRPRAYMMVWSKRQIQAHYAPQ